MTLTELRAVREIDPADGSAPARHRAAAMDAALAEISDGSAGVSASFAVVAVGGYGRGVLSPHSDVDLLVLVSPHSEVTPATVRGLLYPLWDAGYEVGHAVRTPAEAVQRADDDLDAATAVLSSRLIFGDDALYQELIDRRTRWIGRNAKRLVRRIVASTKERHERAERAGWVLAPDLKEDVGALRDVHRLEWLERIAPGIGWPADLTEAHEHLMAVREALHSRTKRRQDRIHLDLQVEVAKVLGMHGADAARELMHVVHTAARTIEHRGALLEREMAASVLGGPKRSGAVRALSRSARVDEGMLTIDPSTPPSLEPALDLVARRAHTDKPLSPFAATWLERAFRGTPLAPWSNSCRTSFFEMLRGPHVVEALEALEHADAWATVLPEWLNVRSLAQHDPYHRYTVDGHLFVAVSELRAAIADDPLARRAAEEAGDLDDLRLATLLHDIGKGSGEDHSVAGERLARDVCARIGLSPERGELVAFVVRHHLTLIDTATRRDLDDGAVIASIAAIVEDAQRLRLLYILSIADGRATGPEGWSEWKAALLRDLYKKTLIALETGTLPLRTDVKLRAEEIEAYEPGLSGRALEMLETLPPSYLSSTHLPDMVDDVRLLLAPSVPGRLRFRIDQGAQPGETAITLCVPDRPGTLARTAGVLSLHLLPVLRAQAFATSRGVALQRFIVRAGEDGGWDRLIADLEAAYSGRLALEARLERKIRDYGSALVTPEVRVLDDVSQHSTVIEVRTADALGLLFALAAALGDLDLDIHVAKIDTLGIRVVDTFYVRTEWGSKLGPEQTEEVERSIRHRLARLYGG